MTKRIISLVMILILITLSFSGCFGKTKADQSFAVPIMDEPTSLDPQIVNSNAEKLIISNCFEGLVRVSQNGEIENGVAESYSVSPDGLTYTFNLRHDAHWALFSGHKKVLGEDYASTFDINVYAEDFSFAFKRVLDPVIESPYAYMFASVASYEAVDNYTFTVRLKYKDDNFLYSLTCPGAMPCDEAFYDTTAGKYGLDAKYLLCNGPFNVSKWTEKTSIKIVRNDDYKGENKVKPSSVTFYLNDDETEVATKVGNGTYDVGFLNATQYNSITEKKHIVTDKIENTVYSLIFNQSDKYLANKNVRLAIAYATDLSLVSTIGDNVSIATGVVPPFCRIGNEPYWSEGAPSKAYQYDAVRAKDYFDQGLLEIGSSSVELEIKCTEEYETFIRQVVQSLQKTLGVKFVITVTVLSQGELKAAISDGNYSVVFYPFSADSILTSDFLENFAADNIFNYSSAKYEANLMKIRSNSGNYTELRKYCEEAENQLISDAVMIPVMFENSYFVTSDETKDIYFYSSKNNIYFINATKK